MGEALSGDVPLSIYADWLEEQGEDTALLRLLIEHGWASYWFGWYYMADGGVSSGDASGIWTQFDQNAMKGDGEYASTHASGDGIGSHQYGGCQVGNAWWYDYEDYSDP